MIARRRSSPPRGGPEVRPATFGQSQPTRPWLGSPAALSDARALHPYQLASRRRPGPFRR